MALDSPAEPEQAAFVFSSAFAITGDVSTYITDNQPAEEEEESQFDGVNDAPPQRRGRVVALGNLGDLIESVEELAKVGSVQDDGEDVV
ncbi:MAG: hypothetical protein L6R35_001205 [Caloplaca aegaea]|nr:MAG: hypothetical protein L6R35_001205 [Caloplaca aegaea]